MKRTTQLMKGLLGASALTILSAGAAQAQLTAPPAANGTNTYTPAGEAVDNTFSLTYEAGGTPRTLANPNTASFVVDRLVSLEVVGSSRTGVLPGANDQTVQFAVTNLGNDNQGYILETEHDAGQDFVLTDATPTDIFWYIAPADGICDEDVSSATAYTAGTSVPPGPNGLAPNAVLCVIVSQDIDANANDTESADIDLIARTTAVGVNTALDANNTDPNTNAGVENVYVDGNGDFTGDGNNDGADSATSIYTVGAPNVMGSKTVSIISQDGSGCGTIPAGAPTVPATNANDADYFVPGACIEYVIEITNGGSQAATAVEISDLLPIEVTYVESAQNGFAVDGTRSTNTANCVAPDVAENCTNVMVSGATVAAASGGTDTEAQLIIRATVN